jgi:ubiquinone/menaquinone biosynthesis C-methylase UbiE
LVGVGEQNLTFTDNSVDIIISNCVVNLSPNKEQVFKEMHRVLKPGGEIYFSDVFADRRISEEYRSDKVLWGECLRYCYCSSTKAHVVERSIWRTSEG